MTRIAFAMVAGLIALEVPGSAFQIPASVRAIVSRADRVYTTPVTRREDGIPIGNGRMSTLVWTTARALKFQINSVDVEPIDLELADDGADVFTVDRTHQRLSVYEGLLDVRAAGVNVRTLAWPERDVIAIDIEDRRAAPEPIQIHVRTRRSDSQIATRDGRILLTQPVQGSAKPAVAIALLGRRALTRLAGTAEAQIVSPAERGRVVVLIASVDTVGAGQDAAAAALANLDAAAAKSFDDLAGDTAEWWYEFWQHSAIASNSSNDYYSRYLMRATNPR